MRPAVLLAAGALALAAPAAAGPDAAAAPPTRPCAGPACPPASAASLLGWALAAGVAFGRRRPGAIPSQAH